jgi:hypothetical protein
MSGSAQDAHDAGSNNAAEGAEAAAGQGSMAAQKLFWGEQK